ncbi:Protein of unknown function [Cribrihabitans marinus]|uniref:Uncharacterized protein n=1 Tax=Cribrihabitans marinus TaxID=1227549 RepID=A0A1H7DX31_9RHOB|nr:DUF3626 domain-containing protein [Cribrihabitans marinus]GGH40557.1 hypothetical protein GCM10010973_36970 [Cribrihabitans marinus]SEK05934.1 Protein of unknown function [Cribrihabitans marinus]
MPKDGLKKLYVTFRGDTAAISLFLKQCGSTKALAAALKAADWDLSVLRQDLLDSREKAADKADRKLAKGEKKRDAAAEKDAAGFIDAEQIESAEVKALAGKFAKVAKAFEAQGFDPKGATPDMQYLDVSKADRFGMGSPGNVMAGDVGKLLDQEPAIKMGKILTALSDDLAKIRKDAEDDDQQALDLIAAQIQSLQDRLAEFFNAAAPAPRKMPRDEQYMVPGATDMGAIEDRLEKTRGIDTESQAWALEGAEIKGEADLDRNRLLALDRLIEIGKRTGAGYDESHLQTVLDYIAKGKIATNYWLSQPPGYNVDKSDQKLKGPSLASLLVKSKNFKNVWETGASQASNEKNRRGGVEEGMGYGAALKRTEGTPQDFTVAQDTKFRAEDPSDGETDPAEMPKYAAQIGDTQAEENMDGVSQRYGDCFVIWKDDIRERITHTPADSWSPEFRSGVMNFTSNSNPEVLLAEGDYQVMRLLAAEATGKDQGFIKEIKDSAEGVKRYVETQIHGDLTWEDVDVLVLGGSKDEQEKLNAMFTTFKKKEGHSFKIQLK